MSINEKMTTLANDIRGINGVSDILGLDAMHTQLVDTQSEVNEQADLIEQIREALQNKTSVSPVLQEKTVVPTEEQQIILPDTGFDGLSKVIVEAMENNASSIFTTTATLGSRNQTISFTGLTEQPKMFAIIPTAQVTLSTSYRYVVNVVYDGTTTHGIYAYGSSSTYRAYYSNAYFTTTYSDGTLSIKTSSTSNGGYFMNGVAYRLVAITGEVTSSGGDNTGGGGSTEPEEPEVTKYYLIQGGQRKVTFDSTDYTVTQNSDNLYITPKSGMYEEFEVSSAINLSDYSTLYCTAKNDNTARKAQLVVKDSSDEYVSSAKEITSSKSTVSTNVRSLGANMYPCIYTERISDGSSYTGPKVYIYDMWLE